MSGRKKKTACNPLVGTWRLVSYINKREDGLIRYPLGRDAVGYITYAEDGYMSVALMGANRTKFTSIDFKNSSTEEKIAAIDSYFSYFGKYEIQGNKVIHHVEVSLYPNLVNTNQERRFECIKDRLLLSVPSRLVNGFQQTAHLTWKRADRQYVRPRGGLLSDSYLGGSGVKSV